MVKKKNQTHKQKDEKTTGMTLQTQLGCMRLWANRISISASGGKEGGKVGRTGRGAAEGVGRGRHYLRCWCCCCKYFAGYQHGLVSMLCVWLHPESREGRGEKERKQKGKETNEKGRKEMSKERVTSPPTCSPREAGGRWEGRFVSRPGLPGQKRRGSWTGRREASQHP